MKQMNEYIALVEGALDKALELSLIHISRWWAAL